MSNTSGEIDNCNNLRQEERDTRILTHTTLLTEVDWSPLEKALAAYPATLPDGSTLDCDHFMYMTTAWLRDGTKVRLYKHIDTRNYLNIDTAGRFYRYQPKNGQELAQ